jgi:hypothetical protein
VPVTPPTPILWRLWFNYKLKYSIDVKNMEKI